MQFSGVGGHLLIFHRQSQSRQWRVTVLGKLRLKRILRKKDTGRVRYTEHIVGDGERLFRELEKRKLEGMVAKGADSLYVGGRSEPG